MSLDDMLKATLVASANDAAVALAEYTEGSEDAFVKRMNTRAKELGMKDTAFKNCNGLDEEGHYSSAYDVALMSAELIKHTKVLDYTSIWLDFLRDGKTQIVNTNKLLKSYNGITGLKTGTTSEAGSCISATARRDGMNLIAVSLGCDSTNERFKSVSTMLDYGFNNFGIKVPEKVKNDKIDTKVNIPDSIDAPVKQDRVIGEIEYNLNGKLVEKVKVKAKEDIEECSFANSFRYLWAFLVSL